MTLLKDIHLNYNTDKGTTHSYIDVYDDLFFGYQLANINVCEIGVMQGGSLKMFHEYFTAANIYGVENFAMAGNVGGETYIAGFNLSQPKLSITDLKKDLACYPRINLVICDSTDQQQVDRSLQDTKFQIIIDDGDHNPEPQFKTFENFFPRLNKHGIYIIEDVFYSVKVAGLIREYLKDNAVSADVKILPLYPNTPNSRIQDDALIIVRKN